MRSLAVAEGPVRRLEPRAVTGLGLEAVEGRAAAWAGTAGREGVEEANGSGEVLSHDGPSAEASSSGTPQYMRSHIHSQGPSGMSSDGLSQGLSALSDDASVSTSSVSSAHMAGTGSSPATMA